jgi:ABC-2 type transport system ATP-binding protein
VLSVPTALTLTTLTKHFGPTIAVDDVNLSVASGQVVGFLGPNGAGKSTTLRLALGLLRPTAGSATVYGHAAGSDEARARTAYVPGDVTMWPQLTGEETIDFLLTLHGSRDVAYRRELIERFDLNPRKRLRAYSKGNRQKVALVAAFATRAPLLLLDEPTSGLDPLMDRVFRECVTEAAANGQAVFLSSHILSEVEQLCTDVAMIRNGRLVAVAQIEELRERVGIEFDVTGDDLDFSTVPGVSTVLALPGAVRVRVAGNPQAFFAALATQPVTALSSRESSLEEIFLSYYDESTPH